MKFSIDIAPISKKNSQQIVYNPKTKRPFIVPSKQYKKYEKDCAIYMPFRYDPIDYLVNVQALFYMPTRRKVDLVNLQEALCDVLVKYGILADDNSSIVVSMDGSRVLHDKQNPRTEVTIERIEQWQK